jgi:hypothetical protein
MIRFSGVLICFVALLCLVPGVLADQDGPGRIDVKLPNGMVVTNVPADITQSELKRKLIAAGKATAEDFSPNEKIHLERVRQKQWEAKQRYIVELSNNDELFIINGEKFEARTYCFNIYEGDEVVFLEGSALGVCVSAEILNLRTNEKCSLWCE